MNFSCEQVTFQANEGKGFVRLFLFYLYSQVPYCSAGSVTTWAQRMSIIDVKGLEIGKWQISNTTLKAGY